MLKLLLIIMLIVILKCKFLGNSSNTSRFLSYWSKLYNEGIKKGDKYNVLSKTILILFIDYDDKLIDNISKIDTSWHIREDTYPEFVLTDLLEFHIISLNKLKKITNKEKINDIKDKKNLIYWLKFLKNPNKLEVSEMKKIKEIEKAKNEFEKIQQTDKERELAWLRQKYIWEMSDARNYGYNSGFEKGIEERTKQIAKNMKKAGKPIEEIIEFTGLSEKEIKEL